MPVSAYSAIKKDGKPMYKRAREAEKKGETIVDIPMREMRVYNAELRTHTPQQVNGKKRYVVTVCFDVASGVYIRSLAKEFGRLLGYPATVQSLRRTKIGFYTVEEALKLTDF